MSAPAAGPHSDAIVSLLEGAGVLVGRGQPPAGGGWSGNPGTSDFAGYAVLYPFIGTDGPASLAEPHAGLRYPFQITVVGATQGHAEAVMDAVRAALIGVTPVVAGRTAFPVYQQPGARPVTRDDGVKPPVHYGVAEFHFTTDPA